MITVDLTPVPQRRRRQRGHAVGPRAERRGAADRRGGARGRHHRLRADVRAGAARAGHVSGPNERSAMDLPSHQLTMTVLMTPDTANFAGNVHGGTILKLLDQVAYACASRYAGRYVVTLSVDQVMFRQPIHVGELVTFLACVNHTGTSSMEVGIKVRGGEHPHAGGAPRQQLLLHDGRGRRRSPAGCGAAAACRATPDEQRRFDAAVARKQLRRELELRAAAADAAVADDAPSPSPPSRASSFTAIRAQGAGGQNVNKVSSAVHLRFDIRASSLARGASRRGCWRWATQRITRDGVVVIKAQTHRSQELNRAEALAAAAGAGRRASPTPPTPRVADAADARIAARAGSTARRERGDSRRRRARRARFELAAADDNPRHGQGRSDLHLHRVRRHAARSGSASARTAAPGTRWTSRSPKPAPRPGTASSRWPRAQPVATLAEIEAADVDAHADRHRRARPRARRRHRRRRRGADRRRSGHRQVDAAAAGARRAVAHA